MRLLHGDRNRYLKGCRCEDCTEAQRVWVAGNRADRLASGRLSHGTRSAYDAGCRCEQCLAARRAAYPHENAAWRARYAARKARAS